MRTKFIFLLLSVVNSFSTLGQIPVRPSIPEYMAEMNDTTFGQKFFAEINLNHPDLINVKNTVLQGNYTSALQQWSTVFWNRVALKSNPGKYTRLTWDPNDTYSADSLMIATTVKFQKNVLLPPWSLYTSNMGLPFSGLAACDKPSGIGNPSMEWMKPINYDVYMQSLCHPRILLRHVEDKKAGIVRPYSIQNYMTRWNDITRDYVNNAWKASYKLKNSSTLRTQTLQYYGLSTAPTNWGNSFQTGHIHPLQELLKYWLESIRHIGVNLSAEANQYLSYRTTAEMCYFMMVWPAENISQVSPTIGVINQRLSAAKAVYEINLLLPEFKRCTNLQTYFNAVFNNLSDQTGATASSDFNRDGSGRELSYNYMAASLDEYKKIRDLATEANDSPLWLNGLNQLIIKRGFFIKNLFTNLGVQVLCKGTFNAGASSYRGFEKFPLPLSYTSIAFPWHGLYSMRSGFNSDDFFISLQSPLRGTGHESNDANKLMLEAYGKYLLVANPGEEGFWLTSWSQNTVQVDNFGQAKVGAYPYGSTPAQANPLSGLWHTSDRFDLAESNYTYGYGAISTSVPPTITSVIHNRKVVHLKGINIALVTDEMQAPNNENHTYTQVWHFHKDFPNTSVTNNASLKTITTNLSGSANIQMLQASQNAITYNKFYGQGYSNASPPPYNISLINANARGWFNNGDGYGFTANAFPAVNMHTVFSGTGTQKMVTALIPSPSTTSRILTSTRIETVDKIGLDITLVDGTEIKYYEAVGTSAIFTFPSITAKSLVLVKKPNEITWYGMYQGGVGTPVPNSEFEVLTNNTYHILSEIRQPKWFFLGNNYSYNLNKIAIRNQNGQTKIFGGQNITFIADVPSDLASSYTLQWKLNGNNVGYGSNTLQITTADNDVISCVLTANQFYGGLVTETSNRIFVAAQNSNTVQAKFKMEAINNNQQNVLFTDLSFGNPIQWSWSFGSNAIPENSNVQNPSVVFPTAGSYPITLSVNDGVNSSTINYNLIIGSKFADKGMLRFNTDTKKFENFDGQLWRNLN